MSFPPFDLSGRVVLITGGNGGIGLGFAEGLARVGADICIWGTNEKKNEAAQEKLKQYGTRTITMKCDVTDGNEVAEKFGKTLETFGRVDGCFANAGVGGRAPFEQMSFEEWNRVVNINLNGVFHVFQNATKHMKERAESGDPFGRLVSTSSLAVVFGQAQGEHYAASKGALITMTKALAVEYARYGVTAHTILPGWTETEMTEQAFQWDKFVNNVMPRIPMRRWGIPEDYAGIAIYIMSTASSYHTSDCFLIDGGIGVY